MDRGDTGEAGGHAHGPERAGRDVADGQAPVIAQLIVYPGTLEVLNLDVGFDGSHPRS